MWKKAVDRERKAIEFRKIVENSDGTKDDGGGDGEMEEESPEICRHNQKKEQAPKITHKRAQSRSSIQRLIKVLLLTVKFCRH
ncbi:hypothetical protein F0562_024839 [Nyssa sinensis]|uniref:Uncharacterized protein n=1 Tax=Nyssa sinensis TaxID=561372 RepID=A0A5J5BD84_9ASTE|nr:hypothetical protein F0562_024839 [Nyssa sinensis]